MPQEAVAPGPDRLWTRDFILICLSNLATFIGFQMLMPTLPVYVDVLGGQKSEVGMVIGLFTLTSVLVRPLVGRGLDQHGRKGLFLLGLVVFAVSCLAYNWAATVFVLLMIRLLHGVGWGATSTAAGTVATDIIPKRRLGEGMGYYGLAGTVAMAVAPAAGLYIIGRFNFPTLFYGATLLTVIALVLAAAVGYRKMPGRQTAPRGALFEKAAFRPGLVTFFVTTSYGAIVSFIALYAAEKGIANVGIFFTVYAVTLAVTRPLAGMLLDRRGYDVVIVPGIGAIILAMLILSRAAHLGLFLVAGVFYGLGFGSVQPSMQALTVRNVPPYRRGAANGTFYSAFDLGIGTGAVLWGAVSQVAGYGSMYFWAAVPGGIALVLYGVWGRDRGARDAGPGPGPGPAVQK